MEKYGVRFFSVVLCTLALAGCDSQSQNAGGKPPAAGPVEVGYVTLKAQSVPRTAEISGRVVALATAEIRPQVDGIVRSIDFQEGRPIKAGDVLFHLNDSKFKAALDAATAALSKAQASQSGAQMTFDRNEKLAATSAVSQQTLDDARTALLQAQADVEAAKADLETTKINLDNATIKAPIGGIIGTSAVSVGSLVTQNQADAMATIRQIDPTYVDLVDTSANLLHIREEVAAGRLGRDGKMAPTVRLTLENGQPYTPTGTISLANVNVSESTGTFTLRAIFPNKDRILLPGMFVRASVDLGNMANAFLVPQRAVQRSNTGEPVAYVVSADDKAEQRKLVTNGSVNNDWIVMEGVADGDKLIVDGFQKISAGAALKPVAATIDKDGVVKQTIESSSGTNGQAGPAQ